LGGFHHPAAARAGKSRHQTPGSPSGSCSNEEGLRPSSRHWPDCAAPGRPTPSGSTVPWTGRACSRAVRLRPTRSTMHSGLPVQEDGDCGFPVIGARPEAPRFRQRSRPRGVQRALGTLRFFPIPQDWGTKGVDDSSGYEGHVLFGTSQ